MKTFPVIALIFLSSFSLFAQTNDPEALRRQRDLELQRDIDQRKNQQDHANLRRVTTNPIVRNSSNSAPAFGSGLTKEQKKRRQPDKEDLIKYAGFLKLPKTGIIKIFPDLGCLTKNVVSVSPDCQNDIPQSSFYSFRRAEYASPADFTYKNGKFIFEDYLANSIVVSLGDTPLEQLSADNPNLGFLMDYQPASTRDETAAKSLALDNGFKRNGLIYARSADARENTTYAARIIAYRANVPFMLNNGLSINLLDGDKRTDIVVGFRVVKQSADGSLTLLWKQLSQKESPKID